MLIIPAIDIMGDKVVRLQRGDFARSKEYALTPLEYAKKWQDQGAELIHVVDLDGARIGEPKNLETIKSVIKGVSVKVEVGGGIRTVESVKEYLEAGADRVVLSTKVIEDSSFLLSAKVREYLEHVAVSIDIKHMATPEVVTSGTSGWMQSGDILIDIPSFILTLATAGVKFVNFSDISKDGMMTGPDAVKILNFLKKARKASEASEAGEARKDGAEKLFFTYAGGISSLEDIKTLVRLGADGVDGVIVGRALYENKFSLKEAIGIAR
jgi:phosphoribosylformimino-5-aminoimidazole carboxamide ribotide isomerase